MPSPITMLARCRRGATTVEYGLILALVVLVVVAGTSALGSSARAMWTLVGGAIPAVRA